MNKNHFQWTGVNISGHKIQGESFFREKNVLLSELHHQQITVLSLHKRHMFFLGKPLKKITPKDHLYFLQQLQLLLRSGISLITALTMIAKMHTHVCYQKILQDVTRQIISGHSLSHALSSYPQQFNQTVCQIIHAGEMSGQLDLVLSQLIHNLENQMHFYDKIKKSLFYPACVAILALLIALGLLIFVIPEFKSIYANFGAQLPRFTQMLITLSDTITHDGIIYLILSLVILFLFKLCWVDNSFIKMKTLATFYKTPLLHSFLHTQQITRWSELLSMLLSSGIPLVDALAIVNQTFAQTTIYTALTAIRNAVIQGKSLSSAIDAWKGFPIQAKTMIDIGENANALSLMMKRIANYHKKIMYDTLDRLSKLLEPVIMMAVASLISGLIIAMYLPIFRMGTII